MTAPRAARRVDESMDLLNNIVRAPIDPDYATAPPSPPGPRRSLVVAVVLLVFGLMAGTSLASTLRAAPQVQQERAELQERVDQAGRRVDELRQESAQLSRGNQELSGSGAGVDDATRAELAALEAATGVGAVTGPGVLVVVDDGDPADRQAQIVDADLRQLVNQLWHSGAEAVAINGHRLSSRTAIRGAGDAITVDYRSLTRPYRVEAIGDADAMIAQFPSSSGGQWWSYLRQNYGVGFELTRADSLALGADPELRVDRAEPGR
ncbi:MAG: DUF881 domain-containing protein [Propionicimonas sp.]|nr:DUF881 domain-containing protein [Propionicimonas sp.]